MAQAIVKARCVAATAAAIPCCYFSLRLTHLSWEGDSQPLSKGFPQGLAPGGLGLTQLLAGYQPYRLLVGDQSLIGRQSGGTAELLRLRTQQQGLLLFRLRRHHRWVRVASAYSTQRPGLGYPTRPPRVALVRRRSDDDSSFTGVWLNRHDPLH